MSGFRPADAALEGFRITRERFGTVFAWSGIYALGMFAIGGVMLASLGEDALAIARKGQFSAEDAQAFATRLVASIPAFLLVLLLAVVLVSVITAGIYRLVLRPQESGFLHLRLGQDELRLIVVNVILFGIGLLCLVAGFALIALIERSGPAVGVIGVPLVAAITIWIGVRLSLATPMAFQEKHISLSAAWGLTKGQFWPLCGMIVLSVIFYVIVWLLISIIWYAIVMFAGGPSVLKEGETAVALVAGVVGLVIQMLISVIQLVMIYSPFAVAYQRLHGDPLQPWVAEQGAS